MSLEWIHFYRISMKVVWINTFLSYLNECHLNEYISVVFKWMSLEWIHFCRILMKVVWINTFLSYLNECRLNEYFSVVF